MATFRKTFICHKHDAKVMQILSYHCWAIDRSPYVVSQQEPNDDGREGKGDTITRERLSCMKNKRWREKPSWLLGGCILVREGKNSLLFPRIHVCRCICMYINPRCCWWWCYHLHPLFFLSSDPTPIAPPWKHPGHTPEIRTTIYIYTHTHTDKQTGFLEKDRKHK